MYLPMRPNDVLTAQAIFETRIKPNGVEVFPDDLNEALFKLCDEALQVETVISDSAVWPEDKSSRRKLRKLLEQCNLQQISETQSSCDGCGTY